MNTHRWLAAILGALLATCAVADDDDDGAGGDSRKREDVAPVADATYAKECGGCHFAYQPGLLPARSWQKLMGNLSDHFGDNAELSKGDAAAITEYLAANAADRSDYRRSVQLAESVAIVEVPLRITQTPYMTRRHSGVWSRHIKENPGIKSTSNCPACHTRAEAGSYAEHEVKIPGQEDWDD